jgi:hypothetical protein
MVRPLGTPLARGGSGRVANERLTRLQTLAWARMLLPREAVDQSWRFSEPDNQFTRISFDVAVWPLSFSNSEQLPDRNVPFGFMVAGVLQNFRKFGFARWDTPEPNGMTAAHARLHAWANTVPPFTSLDVFIKP